MYAKKLVLLWFVLVLVFASGCLSPADINKKIADTYRGLDSLSYDVKIERVDTYDKPYTAYIFKTIEEAPFVQLGESQTISGSTFEWNSKVFIKKPDKKAVITTGSHSAYVSGGQLINDAWYFSFEPAGTEAETKEVCKEAQPSPPKEGEPPVEPKTGECKEEVSNAIWSVPSELDNPDKFKVETIDETINGVAAIKVTVESTTGDFFYIGDIDAAVHSLPFNKVVFWFKKDDLTLIKFEGTLAKSKTASETEIGLSTVYTMHFSNMVFNPEIPAETFEG